MQLLLAVIFAVLLVSLVSAQNGPPRLSIPGAFLAADARPQFRNERLNNVGPLTRIRRPLAKQSNPNSQPPIHRAEEAKPVTEDPEDNIPESFVPQILQHQQQQALLQAEGNSIQDDSQQQIEEKIQLPRFQERPAPQRLQDIQNAIGNNAQRFSLTERPPKPTTLRSRPIHREPRPQFEQPQQIQHQSRAQNFQPRPQQFNPVHHEDRTQKPVAQILRKWREENEDGTITWGFENDDGSFKEEVIGTDCVTRGRYGYVDPDGLKREYNYETGILCDPNKRDQLEEDDEKQGFINYENNKAVLPNGVEIDLSLMGKKKSKRPGAVLTNPQQFYSRN